jgi:hypothetical protein
LNYTPGISTTGIKKKILDNTYQIIDAQLRRENESSDRWARQSPPLHPPLP